MLTQDECYEALLSGDRDAYDGQFFIAVSTTGIYCRSVCHARLPKRENLTFYQTAAQAEAAGYRPCLQCLPEMAPGMPVSSNTLHHGGVSAEEFVLMRRLHVAKLLVAKTTLPLEEVARATGFTNVAQLAATFKERYRFVLKTMTRRGANPLETGFVSLQLSYRPPYDWERIIAFLEMRAIPGVELVRDGTYFRTVRLPRENGEHGEVLGWLSLAPTPKKNTLTLKVSMSLIGNLACVVERVSHQFDLNCLPQLVDEGLADFKRLCPNRYTPGTRVPGCFDSYEMSVRAILGQQISVKGASTLAGRVAVLAGTPVDAGIEGLAYAFPGPAQILELENAQDALGGLGIIGRRVQTIIALAKGLQSGELDLSYGANPETVIPALEAMPGIGAWTAQYISMRTIGYADAFPSTDLGVKKALAPRKGKEIEAAAAKWSPWRAYATISLWSSGHE